MRRFALAAVAGLALAGMPRLAPARAAEPALHFASADRARVVVEDRTADPAWAGPLARAVADWNTAGVVRLELRTEAAGDCAAVGRGVLAICTRDHAGTVQGTAWPYAEGGHLVSGRAWVCATCGPPARRRAIAAHELGHLLGLGHSGDPGSVMCPTACALGPSPADLAQLRANHDHDDRMRLADLTRALVP